MKTTHYLKTDPAVFAATMIGHKTHEIRLNDRDFKVGDTLVLRETTETGAAIAAGAPLAYTGRRAVRVVTHVLEGYGLAPGWCVLSCALPDDEADADEAIRLAAIALAADSVGDFLQGAHWSRGGMLAERAGHIAAIGHLSALVDELRGRPVVEWQARAGKSGEWRRVTPMHGETLAQRVAYLRSLTHADGSPSYELRALCIAEEQAHG